MVGCRRAPTASSPLPPSRPRRRPEPPCEAWPRSPYDGCGGTNSSPSGTNRSEEHTSELQSLMRISYAVFCLKKKKINQETQYYIKKHKLKTINHKHILK